MQPDVPREQHHPFSGVVGHNGQMRGRPSQARGLARGERGGVVVREAARARDFSNVHPLTIKNGGGRQTGGSSNRCRRLPIGGNPALLGGIAAEGVHGLEPVPVVVYSHDIGVADGFV